MDYEFDIYEFDVIRDILSEDFCDNFVEFITDNYECELKDKDDNPLVYIGIGLAYLENKKKLTKKLLERIIKALNDKHFESRMQVNKEYYEGFLVGVAIIVATVITVASYGTLSAAGVVLVAAAITTGATIAHAAATDSTMVVDLSVTISDGEKYTKHGGSIVVDFKDDEANFYSHNGLGIGGNSGLSYSTGWVYNYDTPKDYAGDFIDASAGYGAYGVDHCWSPWGNYGSSTKATSITFSYPYTNSVGGSVGYDYYSEPYKLFDWR